MFCLSFVHKAQNIGLQWVKQVGNSAGIANASQIITDDDRNIYTIGNLTGLVDFDPGPLTYTLSNTVNSAIFISKSDSNGNFVWAKQINGYYGIDASFIHINNHVLTIIGTFGYGGAVDFDPSPATYSLMPNNIYSSSEYYILKLADNGSFISAKPFYNTNSLNSPSIQIDKFNNLYFAFNLTGTVDVNLDPIITYTLSNQGSSYADVSVVKLDSNLNFIWAKQLGSSYAESLSSIKIDKSNLYLVGSSQGPAFDFDPGVGIFNSTPTTQNNAFILKLDTSGTFIWAKQLIGSASGTTIGGESSIGTLNIDKYGYLFCAGRYYRSIDFDPSPSNSHLLVGMDPMTNRDLFILKLDANGDFKWVKDFKSMYSKSFGNLLLDSKNNIYTIGSYQGIVDIDPNAGSKYISPTGSEDLFQLKLDSVGDFLWVNQLHNRSSGTSGLFARITIDKSDNIITNTLNIDSYTDLDPGSLTYTINNLSFAGSSITQKLGLCSVNPPAPINTTPAYYQNTCSQNPINLSASSSGFVYWYKLITDTIPFYIGNSYNTSLSVGNYTYYTETSKCNVSLTRTPITVNVEGPVVTVLGPTYLCPGETTTITVSGVSSYTWNTGVINNNIIVSAPIPSSGSSGYSYFLSATVTNSNCIANESVNIGINQYPYLTVIGSNTICVGSSIQLYTGGAETYTWSNGATTPSISVSPINTSVYSVTSCGNTSSINIVVDNNCQIVWPGDVNSDGIVNNVDILELGLHINHSGNIRNIQGVQWKPYSSNDWYLQTLSNGKNLSHSDCDGSGTVNLYDTLAIYLNYGLTHTFKLINTSVTNPALNIIPDQNIVDKGNWGSSSIYLGDITNQMNNINGVAYTLIYDNSLIEQDSIYLTYQNSFVDSGQNLLFRKTNFNIGALYTASTHTNNINVNGYGKIATLHYKIRPDLTTDSPLNLAITQAVVSSASGSITPITSGASTVIAMGSTVGIKDYVSTGNLLMYPNPTKDVLMIELTAASDNAIISIYNTLGQVVSREAHPTKQIIVNTNNFIKGLYFVELQSDNQVLHRAKFIKE